VAITTCVQKTQPTTGFGGSRRSRTASNGITSLHKRRQPPFRDTYRGKHVLRAEVVATRHWRYHQPFFWVPEGTQSQHQHAATQGLLWVVSSMDPHFAIHLLVADLAKNSDVLMLLEPHAHMGRQHVLQPPLWYGCCQQNASFSVLP